MPTTQGLATMGALSACDAAAVAAGRAFRGDEFAPGRFFAVMPRPILPFVDVQMLNSS